MKTKYLITFIVIGLALTGSASLINKALAQEASTADIQYPVEELGGCKNETDCRSYCDKKENTNACLDFAQKNNLMSDEEVSQAKKFLASGEKGPGGCKGKDSCEQYCNDISHIDECISYAEKNNIMSPQELEEAKKVQSAIAKGVKPPACGNKKECDVYCEDPNHMEECITFGVAAGFIQGKELEDSQKMLAAIKKGVKPPPCRGKDACDEYCSSPDNMEVCMNFAMEAGFMNEQEKADSQKILEALRKGVKPPSCKGREECDVYCGQEEHFEECTNFATAAGFMSEKDAEMARKTGGKGPGGCKSKDECEAFCNNIDNQETCFNFGRDNGMIPEEDLKRMEEGKQQMKQSLQQAPAEVLDCLKTEVGADMVEKMMNGAMPQRDIGEKMRTCFEKGFNQIGPPNAGEPGSGGMIPPAGQAAPGGCKTAEECKTYCDSNPAECKKFQPGPGTANPGGQIMPQQAGPGGCKGPEECKTYCDSNPAECKNFQPSPGGQGNRQDVNRIEGQMQPARPCEGEGCQGQLNQLQFGQELREGQAINGQQLPPPTGPGAGGSVAPGDFVPQVQPAEQQPQQPAPSETPPPASFIINKDSFIGSLIYAVFKFLTKH